MRYLQPDWPAPQAIKAYTTLRSAFEEAEKYPSTAFIPLPDEPVWLTQIHSNIVLEATHDNRDQPADAAFTTEPNRVCAVLTADCLPVLICNKQGTHVAAAHAGWRGLAGGILENTVQSLHQDNADLLVWLGPAIGPKKFEVGKDVFDAFTQGHEPSVAAFIPCDENKWLANLYELARIRLKSMGISRIYGGNYCTYSEEDLFFSYRREKGKTGRMASLIWISQEL